MFPVCLCRLHSVVPLSFICKTQDWWLKLLGIPKCDSRTSNQHKALIPGAGPGWSLCSSGSRPFGTCLSPKLFVLPFKTVSKLQLQSSNESHFMAVGHHDVRKCIKGSQHSESRCYTASPVTDSGSHGARQP